MMRLETEPEEVEWKMAKEKQEKGRDGKHGKCQGL